MMFLKLRNAKLILLFVCFHWLAGCMSRNYTHYLIDTPIEKNETTKEGGTPIRPYSGATSSTMKVRWNDGNVFTEVDVPLLASGQRVIIEHNSGKADKIKGLPVSKVVPPAPTIADKSLSDAYRERGLKENAAAPDVSISRSRGLVQDAIAAGNYSLALEYAELVLGRYPSHPEFLRAKGSILLLMGEREKAIQVYEQAEEIESDPKVRKKLEELRKGN